jgi:uncharacterized protein YbaA (DUF1428 family)
MAEQNLGVGSRIEHPKFGKGVVVDTDAEYYYIWFKADNTARGIAREFTGMTVLEKIAGEVPAITLEDVKRAIEEVIDEKSDLQEIVPLAQKWNRGVLIMKPEDPKLQPKEIPIDMFFHKIVMLRDRLRVLEQNINAHKILTDTEKVDLQQYVTRIYGSLTTFNILFKNTEDQFKGTGGEK